MGWVEKGYEWLYTLGLEEYTIMSNQMRDTIFQSRHWFLNAFSHLISNQCCEIRIIIINNLELRKLNPERLKYLAKVTELIYCRTSTEIHIPKVRFLATLPIFFFFTMALRGYYCHCLHFPENRTRFS